VKPAQELKKNQVVIQMPELQELSESKCLVHGWLERWNVKKQSSVSQNSSRLMQIFRYSESWNSIVGEATRPDLWKIDPEG
jgi:hypothetical protein